MYIVKMLNPRELNLTDDEIMYLQESCEGNADNCYFKKWLEDGIEEGIRDEDELMQSILRKILNSGFANIGDCIMIDCTW